MSLYSKYADQIETFVNVCHRLADARYVTGYGGNMAWKLEEDVILITPTQMNKGDITAQRRGLHPHGRQQDRGPSATDGRDAHVRQLLP